MKTVDFSRVLFSISVRKFVKIDDTPIFRMKKSDCKQSNLAKEKGKHAEKDVSKRHHEICSLLIYYEIIVNHKK